MPGSMINMLSNVAPTPPQTLSCHCRHAPPTEMTGAAKAFNDFFGGSNTYTPGPSRYAGGEDYLKGVESVTGPMHQPQTTAGHYAQTAGEFVPGALLGSRRHSREYDPLWRPAGPRVGVRWSENQGNSL
jgi:hypothetical protein